MADIKNTDRSASHEAEKLLIWAKENNLIAQNAVEEVIEVGDNERSECTILPKKLFEEHKTKEILRKKPISLIGFNEKDKTVLVFTSGKLTQSEKDSLPYSCGGGVNIDYIYGGLPYIKGNTPNPHQPKAYYLHNERYCCGSSVFPANCIGAGTLGFFAIDETDVLYGISNNHVTGACNNAQPDLPILAPGPIDVTSCSIDPFTIGRHSRLLPIHDGIPENISIINNFDAASFKVSNRNAITSMQGNFYDTPSSVMEPVPGMKVEKVGRTTGYTKGTILAQSASPVPVFYKLNEYNLQKTVYFDTVFIVATGDGSLFSDRGDSGSLVVFVDDQSNRHSVGIVFAGNDKRGLSFILPISPILRAFNLRVCSGLNT